MIERVCLVLAALAGVLVIGATATYGVARPAGRIGTGVIQPVGDHLPVSQQAMLKERD